MVLLASGYPQAGTSAQIIELLESCSILNSSERPTAYVSVSIRRSGFT